MLKILFQHKQDKIVFVFNLYPICFGVSRGYKMIPNIAAMLYCFGEGEDRNSLSMLRTDAVNMEVRLGCLSLFCC